MRRGRRSGRAAAHQPVLGFSLAGLMRGLGLYGRARTGLGDAPGVARRVAAVIRRIIGVPDYAAYIAHMRSHHPGQDPLSERDFHREQLTARYARPGSRCC